MANVNDVTTKIETLKTKVNSLSTMKPTQSAKTVTPTAASQIVTADSGYDGLAGVVVNGDENLVAENIKSGVNIFGVSGIYTGGGAVETCTLNVQSTVGEIIAICYTTVDDGGNIVYQVEAPKAYEVTITCLCGSIVFFDTANSTTSHATGCELIYSTGYATALGITAESGGSATFEYMEDDGADVE